MISQLWCYQNQGAGDIVELQELQTHTHVQAIASMRQEYCNVHTHVVVYSIKIVPILHISNNVCISLMYHCYN